MLELWKHKSVHFIYLFFAVDVGNLPDYYYYYFYQLRFKSPRLQFKSQRLQIFSVRAISV